MSITATNKTIYTIPASVSFVDTLASGLLEEVKNAPETLSQCLILLPTRRACRALQDAFLRQTNGKPILLPQLQPFGDIDEEELFISSQSDEFLSIPPALPPLKRQILLAQAISKIPDFSKSPDQDMALANALGQLMDQIHTENLSLKDLPHIVDRETFADHWQITIDFLSILSDVWPKILKEYSAIDAADRRNRLMNALNNFWQKNPPTTPVIAAGSTGSIPATAKLLKTILTLPKGQIILPGLDQNLNDEIWQNVEEGHPQATLKILLENLNLQRNKIKNYPHVNNKNNFNDCEKIISDVMIPASHTQYWQNQSVLNDKEKTKNALQNVKRYDCKSTQDEANLIALILRETLEEKNKIAALVTPDRDLARRITLVCKRWGIELDDSAGRPLSNTNLGRYIISSARCAVEIFKPVSLLSFLKNDLNQGAGFKNFRKNIRLLEKYLLRGKCDYISLQSLIKKHHRLTNDLDHYNKIDEDLLNFILFLEEKFQKLSTLLNGFENSFSKILTAHIELIEAFSSAQDKAGDHYLWHGDTGEAASNFLSNLRDCSDLIPDVNGHDYLAILDQLMNAVSFRPKYGTHPRLMILGQLEARLIQADRVILASLNEGTWPPDPGHDPWMSRPMRQKFGLPLPERSVSLSAHDFAQGFCNKEVFLTRSERTDGTPRVPARWLQRLDTYLQALDLSPNILKQGKHQQLIQKLDHVKDVHSLERPKPKPLKETRPKKLSVTRIETWLKDPYAIYARHILKLKQLDPLEKPIDAAERGNKLHAIMEKFTNQHPDHLGKEAGDDFISIARDVLLEEGSSNLEWNYWMPRLNRLSEWVINQETQWREGAKFNKSEVKGHIDIHHSHDQIFTLSARADRIDDVLGEDKCAVIDYKSGGTYTLKAIESGDLPQLSLEGLILNKNGFATSGITKKKTAHLSYWKMTGGRDKGEITELSDQVKLNEAIERAENGLINLIETFYDDDVPFMAIPRLDNSPRFNDYEYLERVKEWAALGENSEEAA